MSTDDYGSRCEHAPRGRYSYGPVEDLESVDMTLPDTDDGPEWDALVWPVEACDPEGDLSVTYTLAPWTEHTDENLDRAASLALSLPTDTRWATFDGGMFGGGWRVACTPEYPPATHEQMRAQWPEWPYGP